MQFPNPTSKKKPFAATVHFAIVASPHTAQPAAHAVGVGIAGVTPAAAGNKK